MSWIDHTATRIARSIRRNYPNSGSEEVLTYSLIILLNGVSIVLIVSTTGLFTGHFLRCIIALFAYALLRYFSGGVHLHSSIACVAVSSLLLIALAHTPLQYWNTGFLLDLVSLAIILRLAPKGLENVSRIAPKYYPILKVISAAIICSNLWLHSDVLSMVFITQAISLTTPAYKLVDLLERS